jgi:4-aminobutyrate--pyruvate transaminase
MFGHGFTYSGHPVPTAVALETQRIYDDMKIGDHVKAVSKRFQRRLHALADHPLVGEARGLGLIGAVELVADKAARRNFEPGRKVGPRVMALASDHGLIVRALVNDTLAFCPPLIINDQQIDDMFDRFGRALDDMAAELKAG